MTALGSMSPDTVAALRARAEAATPGPWEAVVDDHGRKGVDVSVWADQGMRDGTIQGRYVIEAVETPSEKFDSARAQADAAFIAAADPATVIALCDHIDTLTRRAEQAERAARDLAALGAESNKLRAECEAHLDEARATIDRVQAVTAEWMRDGEDPAIWIALRRALAGDQENQP